MLKAIIDFLNLKLDLLNYFDMTHCLSEIKSDSEGKISPKEYISDGNWGNINFDAYDGVSYWRLRGEVTSSRVESAYRAGTKVEITIPLKLVFSVRREKLTEDDAYSYDRIRETIEKQFNIDNGALKTQLQASKLTITSPSSNGNPKEVWDLETEETETFEPKYEVVFGSVDIDIVFEATKDCLSTECDPIDGEILHTFDFCKSAVRDKLSPEQLVCLIDALCVVATVTNQSASYSQTIAPGATFPLPFMKVKQSDGSTVNNVDYIPSIDGFSFEADLCGSAALDVSVAVSVPNPNFGDTITITITSTGTPINYRFWLPNPSGYELVQQASNTYLWTVGCVGMCTVHGGANEATSTGYSIAGVGVDSTGFLLDGLMHMPNKATAFRCLSTAYVGLPAINVRRSSDNAVADFTATEITDGTLTTFTGAGDGFVTNRYDQSGAGHDDFQATTSRQPKIVSSGVLVTDSNGNPTAEVVNSSEGMQFFGFSIAATGTVYASYKPIGGTLSGRYYFVLSRNNTPGIGLADDLEISTASTDNNSGTPITRVNGSDISPENRAALGTATLNIESIVTIRDVDWSATTVWISGLPEIFEFCEVGSHIGDMIIFSNNGTEQQAYIEDEMRSYYGYY